MIEGMAKMGFDITTSTGLTETYGPATVVRKHPEWEKLPLAEQVQSNWPAGGALHRSRRA
jgi:fatty-acyl-CoA synthase